MRQLKLARPTVFIMLGYPGSGKTAFAIKFAEAVGAVHLSFDRIRYELYEEPQFTPQENAVVFGLMSYMYEELIARGISVVYDANNNRRTQRIKLRDSAKKHDANSLIIWVQTDLETAFSRASSRDRRKPENKYSYELSQDVFEGLRRALTKPSFEDYVVISGKHVFNNQLHAVVKKLKLADSEQISERRLRPVALGGRVDLQRRQNRV